MRSFFAVVALCSMFALTGCQSTSGHGHDHGAEACETQCDGDKAKACCGSCGGDKAKAACETKCDGDKAKACCGSCGGDKAKAACCGACGKAESIKTKLDQ